MAGSQDSNFHFNSVKGHLLYRKLHLTIMSRRKPFFSEHTKFLHENVRLLPLPSWTVLLWFSELKNCFESCTMCLNAVPFLESAAGSWDFWSQILPLTKPFSAHVIKALHKHESDVPLSRWSKPCCTKVKQEELHSSSTASSTNTFRIKLRYVVPKAAVSHCPHSHLYTALCLSMGFWTNTK